MTEPTLRILVCSECYRGLVQVDNAGNLTDKTLTCPLCNVELSVMVHIEGQRIHAEHGNVDVSIFNLPIGTTVTSTDSTVTSADT